MRSAIDRVVFSRSLTPEEQEVVGIYVASVLISSTLEENYYYVDLGNVNDKDTSMKILTFSSKEVQWQANELMCTDLQAVYAIAEYDGFYEELMELLWVNEVNDYDRYIAQTEATLVGDEPVRHCIARSEKDALFYFDSILGFKNIITIRKDNEEIF
jgi:hypothetical protein